MGVGVGVGVGKGKVEGALKVAAVGFTLLFPFLNVAQVIDPAEFGINMNF